MLMHLAASLAQTVVAEIDRSDVTVHALQNIAQARIQGDHIVSADPGVLPKIIGAEKLNASTRAVFQKIDDEQSQVGGLRDKLQTYVEINSFRGDASWLERDGKSVIQIALARFQRNDITQPTFLVAENLVDCNLYLAICSWFAETYFEGRLPTTLRAIFLPGGGDTTDRVLGHFSRERRYLTLCITDSDVLVPNGGIGQTAKKCANVELSTLSQHFILPVRSAENLLCADQIRVVLESQRERRELLPRLRRIQHLAATEPWKHLSLKDGVRAVTGPPIRGSEHEYWNRVCGIEDTHFPDEYLLPGISTKLLSWVADHLQTHSPERLDSDPQLLDIWQTITRLVAAWTCGMQPIRS